MPKRKISKSSNKKRKSFKSYSKKKRVKITEDIKSGAIDLFNLKNIDVFPNSDMLPPSPLIDRLDRPIILQSDSLKPIETRFEDITESKKREIKSSFEKYKNLEIMNKSINEKYLEMLTRYKYIERLVKKSQKNYHNLTNLVKRFLKGEFKCHKCRSSCREHVHKSLHNEFVVLYNTLACIKKERQDELKRFVECFKDEIKNN